MAYLTPFAEKKNIFIIFVLFVFLYDKKIH